MSKRQEAYEAAKRITEELKRSLHGRWPNILSGILPELREAIAAGPHKHVTCPYHKGENDFRVRNDFADTGACICSCNTGMTDGFKVIMHARGVDFKTAKGMLLEYLGGDLSASMIPAVYQADKDPEAVAAKDAQTKARIGALWGEAFPLDDYRAAPVRAWLVERGIPEAFFPPASIRCHPALGYWVKGKEVGKYPAMLAMVRGADGKTSTIHRTWLSVDGRSKAPVSPARKQYAAPSDHPVNRSAIRFDAGVSPVLNLAEGIESALSARVISGGMPTWSVLNKELLTQVVVPEYVKIVTVWADRDHSMAGQAAALQLVDRLRKEGRRAVAFLPPYAIPEGDKSMDWNDVLQALGPEGARSLPKVQAWREKIDAILHEGARVMPEVSA